MSNEEQFIPNLPSQTPQEDNGEKIKKPWYSMILLGIIIVFLGVIGFLLYNNYQLKQTLLVNNNQSSDDSSPKIEATKEVISPITEEKLTATFQEILSENCKKIQTGPGSFFYGIQVPVLPVIIRPSLELKLDQQNTLACSGDDEILKSKYVVIQAKNNRGINLYDEYSKEMGHGGPLFLKSLSTSIGEKNGILFSISIGWPEGGCASPSDMGVYMRGVKSLKLSNGETIFINTSTIVINAGDQKLTEILSENTTDCEIEPGAKTVVYDGAEDKIKNYYFSNLNSLGSNEQRAVEEITNILNMISPK